MISIYDHNSNRLLKVKYADEETFINESWYKRKEQIELLHTLYTNKPVNNLPEIFGLQMIQE